MCEREMHAIMLCYQYYCLFAELLCQRTSKQVLILQAEELTERTQCH